MPFNFIRWRSVSVNGKPTKPLPAFRPVLSAVEALFCNLQRSIETGLTAFEKVVFTVLIFIHWSFLPAIQRHSRIPPGTSNVSPELWHEAFSIGLVG